MSLSVMMRLILLTFLSLAPIIINAQKYEGEITVEELFTNLATKTYPDSIYMPKYLVVTSSNFNFSPFNYLNTNFPDLQKIDGRIVIPNSLYIARCKLPDRFTIDSLHFKKRIVFFNSKQEQDVIYFQHMIQLQNILSEEQVIFDRNEIDYLNIRKSIVKKEFYINSNRISIAHIAGNKFEGLFDYNFNVTGDVIDFEDNTLVINNSLSLRFENGYRDSIRSSTAISISNPGDPAPSIYLQNNKIVSEIDYNLTRIIGKYTDVEIRNNDFDGLLVVDASASGKLKLEENDIDYLDLSETGFSETYNRFSFRNTPELVAFDEISGYSALRKRFILWLSEHASIDTLADNVIEHGQTAFNVFTGKNKRELSRTKEYYELMRAYYYLQNIFHTNGHIEHTNLWYVKMKDLEGQWLKYQYQETGSTSNLFRYGLNRLMKFYTEHGTNPGRAILVSIWIILAFAFVYVFFPSEWDKTSKGKLVSDFRTFIKKNDHGYFKPFVKLTAGFFISVLNALTLSLNSFVTLGFGRIPTTGAAKYICILQGFIGWFLLSLFTVSLINQILF